MKKLNLVLAGIGSAALMSYGVSAYAGDSVTLAAGGTAGGVASKFTVQFVSKVGNTWTYQVSQTSRALSHWSLGIENCEGKVSNPSPAGGFESGQGGVADDLLKNTGVDWMIKWNTGSGVSTSGTTFSFTLDGEYESTDVGVLVKTGGNPQKAVGSVTGPDCSKPVTPPPPVLDCTDAGYATANPEECAPPPPPPVLDCTDAGYATANPEECAPPPPPPVLDCSDEGYATANPEECTVTPPPVLDCDDAGYAAENPEECTVTYGDSKASVIGIWKYVGSMSVQDFDATYKEGTDYVFTGDDSGEYLLQGIDDEGKTTSMSGAKMK